MVKALTLALLLALPCAAHAQTDPKELIEAKANGKWGVIDKSGKTVVPFDYDSVFIGDSGVIDARGGRKTTHFDTEGKPIWPDYPSVDAPDRNGYLQVRGANGLTGLVDSDGRVLLPMVFTYLSTFDDNRNYVFSQKGKAGVVGADGKVVIPPTFFYITALAKNGLAIAKSDAQHYGVIDASGKWVIEPGRFDEIHDFSDDGLASAKADGKWGFIDAAGKWVIPPISEDLLWIAPFNQLGTTPVMIGGKWGFIDRSGKIVVTPQFDEVSFAKNGEYVVTLGDRVGLIDGRARYILQPVFAFFTLFDKEGLAMARVGTKSFIIDRSGKSVFGDKFDRVGGFFGGGWAAAQSNGKWGAIDTGGNWIVKPTYECISICFDGPPATVPVMPPSG